MLLHACFLFASLVTLRLKMQLCLCCERKNKVCMACCTTNNSGDEGNALRNIQDAGFSKWIRNNTVKSTSERDVWGNWCLKKLWRGEILNEEKDSLQKKEVMKKTQKDFKRFPVLSG